MLSTRVKLRQQQESVKVRERLTGGLRNRKKLVESGMQSGRHEYTEDLPMSPGHRFLLVNILTCLALDTMCALIHSFRAHGVPRWLAVGESEPSTSASFPSEMDGVGSRVASGSGTNLVTVMLPWYVRQLAMLVAVARFVTVILPEQDAVPMLAIRLPL